MTYRWKLQRIWRCNTQELYNLIRYEKFAHIIEYLYHLWWRQKTFAIILGHRTSKLLLIMQVIHCPIDWLNIKQNDQTNQLIS